MNLINSEPTQTEIKMFKYAGLYLFEKTMALNTIVFSFLRRIARVNFGHWTMRFGLKRGVISCSWLQL